MDAGYEALRARVTRALACDHRPTIRVRQDSAGRQHYWEQCMRCGTKLQPVRRSAALGPCAPFDELALQRRIVYERDVWEREAKAQKQQERAAWLAEHDRYLQTPQWRRLRAAVLHRTNGMCEGCGTRVATQVHHLTYDRWQREMLFDLVAVCDVCHAQIHERAESA
jgi:hypothetical protein